MADAALSRSRTPLLDLVRDDALEREYREASRRTPPGASARPGGRAAVAVVVAAFGLLLTLAAVHSSRNADVDAASRAQIISRIETNREALQGEFAALAELRQQNAAAEAALVDLGGSLAEDEARVGDLESATGFGAVTGPGIVITFDNLEGSDQNTEWVRDSDIAALVNGLWVAGAEAIAINGKRITGFGGIRNVGTNVEINGAAIGAPYTVTVVGDPDTLAADLLNSDGGGLFFGYARDLGWDPETRMVTEHRIPAAPAGLRQLRSAHRPGDDPEGGEAE